MPHSASFTKYKLYLVNEAVMAQGHKGVTELGFDAARGNKLLFIYILISSLAPSLEFRHSKSSAESGE